VGYFKPILWLICACVGFGGWWGLSGAKWDADCEEDDFESDEKYELCAENGLYLMIIAFFFTFLAGIVAIINTKM
jgi:hypothetical protein